MEKVQYFTMEKSHDVWRNEYSEEVDISEKETEWLYVDVVIKRRDGKPFRHTIGFDQKLYHLIWDEFDAQRRDKR